MKTYVSLLLLTVLFLSPDEGRAEINNKKALMEFFEGCTLEEIEDFSSGAQFEYCGCLVNEISLGMDIEELMSLSLDIYSADEKEQERLLLTNKKFKKYIVNCVSKFYQ